MTNTPKFNLIKPSPDDFYNIDDFNTNADIIDAELAKRPEAGAGQGYSDENFTFEEKEKLMEIEPYAQENIIEGVRVNNVLLQVAADKTVNVITTALTKATASEAVTGTDYAKYMTPYTTKYAFDQRKATVSEAQAGTNDTKFITPATLKSGTTSNIVYGSYTGDDALSRNIYLGGTPRIILISARISVDENSLNTTNYTIDLPIVLTQGQEVMIFESSSAKGYLTLNGSYLEWSATRELEYDKNMNMSSNKYTYIAFF